MGIFKGHSAEYKDAKRDLDRIADRDNRAGIHDETSEYLKANDRVNKALRNEKKR